MSMLYLAQTVADAHPMRAVGYVGARMALVVAVVIGLIKLITRKRSHPTPPPPPPYGAPHPYAGGQWHQPHPGQWPQPHVGGQWPQPWPPHAPPTPGAGWPAQIPPQPRYAHPPAAPR